MMGAGAALESVKRQRPEWQPWLAVVEEVVREAESRHWDGTVPTSLAPCGATVPLLAGASIAVDGSVVRRLLDRLVRRASACGTTDMATLDNALRSDVDAVALLAASLNQETDHVGQVAAGIAADAEALQAVVALMAIPFLQACNRQCARTLSKSWVEGYCALCGSWPALVEVRGIERNRYFRCGRCGSEWYARALVCAFCGLSDHEQLASLVPAKSDANAVIEACNGCRGYVKSFTRLQGCAPGAVMIEDLASVDLDVAALEHGYARPSGSGYRLGATLTVAPPRRRFVAWNL